MSLKLKVVYAGAASKAQATQAGEGNKFGIVVLVPLDPYAVRATADDPWTEIAGWTTRTTP